MLKTIKSLFCKDIRQDSPKFVDFKTSLDFEYEVSLMVLSAWRDKDFSDKYLSVYDRYTLEFNFSESDRVFSPIIEWIFFDFTIFDENLNVVYSLKDKVVDVKILRLPVVNKRLWELRYWLSLDWEREIPVAIKTSVV